MQGLIVHSHSPCNAEPPAHRLAASFITAQPDFYIRSHGAMPTLDPASYSLGLQGRVGRPLTLTLAALRTAFPVRTVIAALQCAGNRRAELARVRPVDGSPWSVGAIGNAAWTGVSLADVLQAAGAATRPDLHVAFHAADTVADSEVQYAASIPMPKALAPDTLLAFEMNGEPLAHPHGFPVRVVVPGYAGVRSVKWLTGITVRDSPVDSPIQTYDYKLFPPDIGPETADWEQGTTINDVPLNAAICEPATGAILPNRPVLVRGYATASDRRIVRVELSCDNGAHWLQARLQTDPAAPWSWTTWSSTLDLRPGRHEIAVRAWDSAGQTQPERPEAVWNYKGYLCACWHRVEITIRTDA